MKIIEQLNKLPIKSGEYLVLPNINTPYFIIPLHSRCVFNDAISFVKSRNIFGDIKRYALKFLPFIILKSVFPVISVKTKHIDNKYSQLILPWNQDIYNKFTIFNFNQESITLIKIGFGKLKKMIENENLFIKKASGVNNNLVPQIVNYSERKEFSKIETKFYNGEHPDVLPESIKMFFKKILADSKEIKMMDHPYFSKIFLEINHALKNNSLTALSKLFNDNINKYKEDLIPIVLMHGDCTKTNVISKKDIGDVLIDWEDSIDNGMPIDTRYFEFRIQIDSGNYWEINNLIDFLVVAHYIYLLIRHGNSYKLSNLLFENNRFSI